MRTLSARMTAAVAALLVASTMGLSTAAYAADATTSTIDSTKSTSLTIHKYTGPVNSTADCNTNDGQTVSADCLTDKSPLAGAKFDIYKVMDLKTNADWQTAQKTYAAGTYDITGQTPVATVTSEADADGVTASGLSVALYYVVESTTPEGYTGSKPFFITLPMTDPSNGAWDYDLDVYPKNDKIADNHKAVKDGNTTNTEQSSVKVGDTLTYEVSTNVPNYGDVVGAPASGTTTYTAPDRTTDHNDLPSFWVDDYFVSNLEKVAVKSVNLAGKDLETADYGVKTVANADGTTSVRVYLTESGLDKAAASNGAAIIVSYTAVVKSVPDSGEIENQAYTVPGPKPSSGSEKPTFEPTEPPSTPPTNPEEPTNTVVSKFGKIRISKIASDTSKTLADAQFDVYRAKLTYADDGKTITATSCAAADLKGATSLATLTTDGNGQAVSDWLQVSNWYNDAVEKADGGNNEGYLDGGQYAAKYGDLPYCLVETKAPAGYQLLAEPIKFELTEVGAVVDPAEAYTYTKIENQPDNLQNRLPLTGGAGTALFSVAGLVLIGGGLGYYTWSQRRRKDS